MISQGEQQAPKFKMHEIVHVLAQPPRIHRAVRQRRGVVLGWSDPVPGTYRDYAVHISDYGETFAIPEDALESIGQFANPKNIVSRSRAKGRKRARRKVTHNGQAYEVVVEELKNGKYIARIDSFGVVGRYVRQPDIQRSEPNTGEAITRQGPPVEFDTQQAGLDAGEDNIKLGMI